MSFGCQLRQKWNMFLPTIMFLFSLHHGCPVLSPTWHAFKNSGRLHKLLYLSSKIFSDPLYHVSRYKMSWLKCISKQHRMTLKILLRVRSTTTSFCLCDYFKPQTNYILQCFLLFKDICGWLLNNWSVMHFSFFACSKKWSTSKDSYWDRPFEVKCS